MNAGRMQRIMLSLHVQQHHQSVKHSLALAATWKRLAAEFEADARLLQALGDLHLGSEPYEALLLALNIRPCEHPPFTLKD
jgi:hypothetical protein